MRYLSLAATFMVSACGIGAPSTTAADFLVGCWQSSAAATVTDLTIEFQTDRHEGMTGTVRQNSDGEYVFAFAFSDDGQSIDVTTYPAFPFVSNQQAVTLPIKSSEPAPQGANDWQDLRFGGDGHGSQLSFSAWSPRVGVKELILHMASLKGWESRGYDDEVTLLANRIPCSSVREFGTRPGL